MAGTSLVKTNDDREEPLPQQTIRQRLPTCRYQVLFRDDSTCLRVYVCVCARDEVLFTIFSIMRMQEVFNSDFRRLVLEKRAGESVYGLYTKNAASTLKIHQVLQRRESRSFCLFAVVTLSVGRRGIRFV